VALSGRVGGAGSGWSLEEEDRRRKEHEKIEKKFQNIYF
jgi:hypothetical protein